MDRSKYTSQKEAAWALLGALQGKIGTARRLSAHGRRRECTRVLNEALDLSNWFDSLPLNPGGNAKADRMVDSLLKSIHANHTQKTGGMPAGDKE